MLELDSQGGPDAQKPVYRMFRWVDPTRETGHSRDCVSTYRMNQESCSVIGLDLPSNSIERNLFQFRRA